MSNLSTHAELELRSAGLLESKDEYNNAIGKAVLELIEKFSEQGHSGTSAGITIHLFKTLAMFEPLGPLTGEDHEWTEVSNGLYQNKRLSSVFKHEDGVYALIMRLWLKDAPMEQPGPDLYIQQERMLLMIPIK